MRKKEAIDIILNTLMKSILVFLREVKLELTKVTWPKRSDVVKLTTIVLLISGFVGVYVGGLDYLFTKALELVLAK